MAAAGYILYVASYGDDLATAREDFTLLKRVGDPAGTAAVVLDRDSEGRVSVKEHGGLVSGGTAVGMVGGLVIGLFAPALLLVTTAVGAGIGAGVGAIMKRHEERNLGVEADDWLPAGSSAIVAVVDEAYLADADKAVTHAVKKTTKAIDKIDYDAVVKALNEGGADIIKAVDS